MEVHGYTANGSISATIDGVSSIVPDVDDNRERQLIAAWEAEGNTIPAYVAPPAPTPSLEPWRFFAMLELSGKRADLDAFIDALPEPQRTVAKAKLDRSLVFYRDNDLVEQARQAIGMTNEELDAAWTQALSL